MFTVNSTMCAEMAKYSKCQMAKYGERPLSNVNRRFVKFDGARRVFRKKKSVEQAV